MEAMIVSSNVTNSGTVYPGPKTKTNARVTYSAIPADSAKREQIDKTMSLRRTFQVSWWERRTKTEKRLIILVPLLVVSVLVVIAIFAPILAARKSPSPESAADPGTQSGPQALAYSSSANACITWECVQLASQTMKAINRSVDPCEDFFQFACGSLISSNADSGLLSHFHRIDMEQDSQIKELLEAPVSDEDIEVVQTVKKFYSSCINESNFGTSGNALWLARVNETFNQGNTTFDLTEFLAKVRLFAVTQGLFLSYVEADAKNSDWNVIYFDQPKKFRPIKTSFTHFGEKVYTDLLTVLGHNFATTTEDMNKFVEELSSLEAELKGIRVSSDRQDQPALYNRMTVADMHTNLTKNIDWLKFLRMIFNNTDVTIELNEPVVVLVPEYFVKLGEVLGRYPQKIIESYLKLSVDIDIVERFLGYRLTHADIDTGTLGPTESEFVSYFTWYTCVNFMKQNFGFAVSRMQLDKHFKRGNKARVEQITRDIKVAFNETVDELTWIDGNTKRLLKEKVAAMQTKIAYPDVLFNDQVLNDAYGHITSLISYRSFAESAIRIRTTTVAITLAILRHPVNREGWLALPITVNAFYVPIRNELLVPASLMQPPFFDDIDFISAINYGAIGFVIGHELIHGFGQRGRHYDKGGNMTVWWPEKVIATYKEKSKCFVDQYNNYTITGTNISIDGMQTLGENFADNGGIRQAFKAYRKKLAKGARVEAVLPGLNLTGDQLFFLQFAQMMCRSTDFEDYTQADKINLHCPADTRVLGTLSNSEDFAKAYRCKTGSRMNPKNKCVVW